MLRLAADPNESARLNLAYALGQDPGLGSNPTAVKFELYRADRVDGFCDPDDDDGAPDPDGDGCVATKTKTVSVTDPLTVAAFDELTRAGWYQARGQGCTGVAPALTCGSWSGLSAAVYLAPPPPTGLALSLVLPTDPGDLPVLLLSFGHNAFARHAEFELYRSEPGPDLGLFFCEPQPGVCEPVMTQSVQAGASPEGFAGLVPDYDYRARGRSCAEEVQGSLRARQDSRADGQAGQTRQTDPPRVPCGPWSTFTHEFLPAWVSVAAGDGNLSRAVRASSVIEGGDVVFTVTRAGRMTHELAVGVTVSETGNTIKGTPPDSVTIPVGSLTGRLLVRTSDDDTDEPNSVINVIVRSGTGYVSGPGGSAAVTVVDNDGPLVTIAHRATSVAEGANAVFRIARTGSTGEALPVNVNVVRVGAFFSGAAPTLATILAGSDWYDLEIATVPDSVDETDGSVTATLEPGGNAYNVGAAASATVAVLDDDLPLVSVGASASSVTEGEGVTFTVSRRTATPASVTVDITVSKSGDYFTEATTPTSVEIAANATDAEAFTIATVGDTEAEPDGSVAVTIDTQAARYRIGTGSAAVAVDDDDRTGVTISPNTASVREGANAVFTVSRGDAETTNLRVYVSASDVGDFIAGTAPTSVLIAANQSTGTFTVRTDDDTVDEPDGAITAVIQDRTTYSTGSPGSAIMAVLDNDPTVTISSNAASVTEGTAATFTVSRDRSANTSIRVYVDESQVGDFIDFGPPAPSESVLIAANQTSAIFTVATDDDGVVEANGSVTASLRPRGTYSIGASPEATVSVLDNDATVTISRGATSVTEGTAVEFTVRRDVAVSSSLRVYVSVSDVGDFIAGTAPSAVLIGANQTSATLTVGTANDTEDEPNGSVTVTLSRNDTYSVGSPSAATIVVNDNDPTVVITRDTDEVIEGAGAVFTVTRDRSTSASIRVYVDVSQVGNFIDFGPPAPPESVLIGANQASVTFTVATDDDGVEESDGSVTAAIAGRTSYTTGSLSSATVTVRDNDDLSSVRINRSVNSVTEGGSATWTITRDPAASTSLRVYVSVSDVGDFIDGTAPASVLIGANRTTATLTVGTANDTEDEPNGSVTATISRNDGYIIGSPGSSAIPVLDNDPTVAITRNAASVTEGTSATFTVSRDRSTSASLRVYVSVSDDGDFIAGTAPSSVLIRANQTTGTLTVRTDDDTVDEPDGSVTAAIAGSTSYTTGSLSSATVTVRDNDDLPVVRINRSVNSATEGGSATWTITRDPAASISLRVYVSVSDVGDFIAGTVPTSVLIGANRTTATLTVGTENDTEDEPNGSVTATINRNDAYTLGSPGSSAISVLDNDPTVTISRNAVAVAEGTSAVFTVRRDRAATSSIRVYVSVSDVGDFIAGTAPSSVLIRANQTTRTLTVRTDNDDEDEPDGSVTATISPRSTYSVGSSSSATITVRDNDLPVVTMVRSSTTPASVTEGTDIVFRVNRTGSTTAGLPVTWSITQSGTFLSGTPRTSGTIRAGSTNGTFTIDTDDDTTDEANGSVTATLTGGGSTYTIGTPASSTVTVLDNDLTQYYLTVSATANGSASGSGWYDENTSATVTATSTQDLWVFTDWTGDVADSTASSTTVYMDEAQSVTANFDNVCNLEEFFPGCSRRDEHDAPLPGTTGNASPTVSIDTAAQTVAGGASIELAATAVAVDGKLASHSWSGTGSFADGTAEDTTWTAPAAAASERTITLTLTVTSDGGASASASIEIVVAAADSAAGPGNEPGDDIPMEDTEPAG